MAKLYIVRHSNTALNSEDRERGWKDIPLDDKGKRDAQTLANKLSNTKIDIISSSDLQRAVTTAQIIGKSVGVNQLLKDWHLRTWHTGDLAGQDSDTADKVMKEYIDNPSKRLPGGESFLEFSDRFMNALTGLLKQNDGQEILVVTHHKCERLLAYKVTGDKSELLADGCPPAGMTTYSYKGGKVSN